MAKSVVSQSVCYSEGIGLLVSFDAGNASKKDNESIVKQISIRMNEKWSDVKGNAAAGFSIGCDCSIENEGWIGRKWPDRSIRTSGERIESHRRIPDGNASDLDAICCSAIRYVAADKKSGLHPTAKLRLPSTNSSIIHSTATATAATAAATTTTTATKNNKIENQKWFLSRQWKWNLYSSIIHSFSSRYLWCVHWLTIAIST